MPTTDIKVEYQYFYTTKEWTTPEGEHKHQKEPRITVCYLRTEDCTAVGIAICGPRDNPCRKVGKKIARQRAQHALGLAMETEELPTMIWCGYIMRADAADTFVYSDVDVHEKASDAKIRFYADPNYRMKRLTN